MTDPGWDAVVVVANRNSGGRRQYLRDGVHVDAVHAARAVVIMVERAERAGRVVLRGVVSPRS